VGTDPEGLLGLVSANNVVIRELGEDTAQAIRNNGLTIHASIMATSNDQASFSVETALMESVPGLWANSSIFLEDSSSSAGEWWADSTRGDCSVASRRTTGTTRVSTT